MAENRVTALKGKKKDLDVSAIYFFSSVTSSTRTSKLLKILVDRLINKDL